MKQKEKEGQRRLDRKRRDEFRAVLATEHEAGRITHRTKWAEVSERLAETEGYRAAVAQPGGTPLELFEDFVDQLAQTYAAQAKAVRAVLAAAPQLAPTEQAQLTPTPTPTLTPTRTLTLTLTLTLTQTQTLTLTLTLTRTRTRTLTR